MHRSLLVVSAVALLAACGPKPASEAENIEKTPDANPTATLATPANEAAAPDFVMKAATSDMFEIEAAKIAQTKSTNAEVKAFAAMMLDAHTKSSAALKAAVTASGQALTLPNALPEDMQGKLKALQDASAADFDEAYMDGQESAHQATLDTMSRYANDGDVPALKTFAQETMGVVQAHLNDAKALEDKLDD